jgi:pilus assembly protein CpaC
MSEDMKVNMRIIVALFALLALLPLPGNVDSWSWIGQAEAAARVVRLNSENRVGRMQVIQGTSETIKVNLAFSEIVVGDPETADVNPLTDKTLYVLGRKLGVTNIALFDADKQLVGVIDVEVTHDLAGLRGALHDNLPYSNITAKNVNGRIVLQGVVPSAPAAEKAMSIARDFAGADEKVTNGLSIAANQQVTLEVRFIEVVSTGI